MMTVKESWKWGNTEEMFDPLVRSGVFRPAHPPQQAAAGGVSPFANLLLGPLQKDPDILRVLAPPPSAASTRSQLTARLVA